MAAKKKVTKKAVAKAEKVWTDPKTGMLLNSKHEAFAQMWVQTFDQLKSLEAGGYKKPKTDVGRHNQCRSILRREEVKLRVREILKERVSEFAITESFVIYKMMDVYEKAIEEKPIMAKNEDGEMEVVGYEYQDLRVAKDTLKDLGTNIGMFQKRVDDRAGAVVINMNYGDDRNALPAPTVIHGEAKRLN